MRYCGVFIESLQEVQTNKGSKLSDTIYTDVTLRIA